MRMVSKHYKYDEDGLNENVNIVSARLLFKIEQRPPVIVITRYFCSQ